MKKITLFGLLLGFCTITFAQNIEFVDANFKNALLTTNCVWEATNDDATGVRLVGDADTDDDGEISFEEALAIEVLFVSNQNIASLEDLENFTNLLRLDSNNNSLTAIDVEDLTSLKQLNVRNNQITTIDISTNTTLLGLNISDNQLTGLDVTNNVNLKSLSCDKTGISSIDLSQNINLASLSCTNNNLEELDITNNINLIGVNCRVNKLTNNFDVTNNTLLTNLNCGFNRITSLDVTNASILAILEIEGNLITQIDVTQNPLLRTLITHNGNRDLSELDVTQNPELTRLYCGGSAITELDVSNNVKLIQLSCSDIADLDISNNTELKLIWARNSFLTINALDLTVNNKLDDVRISNSNLSSINVSALTELDYLAINNAKLTALDVSNNSKLETLACQGNKFTTLDISNNPLVTKFICGQEELVYINMNNGNNLFEELTNCVEVQNSAFFNVINSPFLEYICVDEEELTCAQKEIEEKGYLNALLGTDCDYTPNYILTGTNKYNEDGDVAGCVEDDLSVPYLKFNVSNGTDNETYIGNTLGDYRIPLKEENTYTYNPVLENPDYFIVDPETVTVTFPSASSPNEQNFCLTPDGEHNDLEIFIIPTSGSPRPGFSSNYLIIYKNKGTTTQSGTVTLDYLGDILTLASANPAIDGSTTNQLSWSFSDLRPFEEREINVTFNLNTPTDTPPVNSGDLLNYTATVIGVTDETPEDNVAVLNEVVVNSFDPNDKACLEGDTIQTNQLGNYIHYMIRFENTGTADAINVVVKDEIDIIKLDIESFVPLRGSHPYETKINEKKELEFVFSNINLPSDDENNDGYVVFKIRTSTELVKGDTIENKAAIYFDFNEPIITEPSVVLVEEQILSTTNTSIGTFKIYPNPSQSNFTVNFSETKNKIGVSIIDLLGKVVQKENATNSNKVAVSHNLSSGIYWIKLEADNAEDYFKLIVK